MAQNAASRTIPHRHRIHTVRPGETLSGIATRFSVNWHELARRNHISEPSRLRVGTELRIDPGQAADLHGRVHAHPHPHPHPPAAAPLPPAPTLPSAPGGPLARPAGGPRLGDLSMRYETGFRPGQEAQAVAMVSTGAGDPGGVSYGAYQLASSAAGGRQVQAFLRAEGVGWATEFAGADATAPHGAFGAAWRAIAAREPARFFQAQHDYIEHTHYSPVVNYVRRASGVDVNARSRSVQNAIWSTSVQHGQAPRLAAAAIVAAGSQGEQSDADYDRSLIEHLYDTRDAYIRGQPAAGLHPLHTSRRNISSLSQRYVQERADALRLLETR